MSWRDVWAVLSSTQPGSRLAGELNPRAIWTQGDHLIASAVDALNQLVWAQSKDGQKNRKRPKPVPRPGDAAPEKENTGRFADVEARPLDEVRELLARPRK